MHASRVLLRNKKAIGLYKVTIPTSAATRRKPIAQLEKYLALLRKKNVDYNLLIDQQNEEIELLKKKIHVNTSTLTIDNSISESKLQEEFQQQLLEKDRIHHKLTEIDAEIKSLHQNGSTALKEEKKQHSDETRSSSLTDQINELKNRLEIRENEYKKKIEHRVRRKEETEKMIEEYQLKYQQSTSNHAYQLAQLTLSHQACINKIHQLHEENLDGLRQKKDRLIHRVATTEKAKLLLVNDALEQLLKEFEHEKYYASCSPVSIKPSQLKEGNVLYQPILRRENTILEHDCNYKRPVNQIAYSQQYMPFEAISWNIPQLLPNSSYRKAEV
ncbi:MAG: hypothetical protein EXX96DRAFT_587869 [Benjaminiella poitrasii]|nr:MAG: hypothetical protein EXX96DRAFT_587869 [Benjaminiella poitrasii]